MDDALEFGDGMVVTDQHEQIRTMIFGERLQTAYHHAASALVIDIAPRIDQLPLPIQRYDDPFLPYGRAIIEATHDVVCGYAFHLSAYLALGAAGAIALERTLAAVPTENIKILHVPFVTADYVRASYEDAFNADAVTLATLDADVIAAYARQPAHGVFVQTTSELERSRLRSLAMLPSNQIGCYQALGDAHYTVTMLDETLPTLHWRWDKPIFTARGDDFRDSIRAAVLQLRQRLSPNS